jgi:hypothetical protein
MKTKVTSHKPGSPGWIPPLPRFLDDSVGYEPVYQKFYMRKIKTP